MFLIKLTSRILRPDVSEQIIPKSFSTLSYVAEVHPAISIFRQTSGARVKPNDRFLSGPAVVWGANC
jgi:hypothetical protein